MTRNKQYKNVANRGDILKHAALVQLAEWFKQHTSGRQAWLETHTFLLTAPLANQEWNDEVQQYGERFAAYQHYLNHELAYVENNQYRCSSGLVLDILEDIDCYLSESDPDTRARLSEQLVAADIQPRQLLYNLHDWPQQRIATPYDALLGLLDPFRLTGEDWLSTCHAVSALLKPGGTGILEVFTWQDGADYPDWPAAPPDWSGPVAVIHEAPCHLAVYVTGGIEEQIKELVTIHGWTPIPAVHS